MVSVSEKLKNLSPEQLELLQKRLREKQRLTPRDEINIRPDPSVYPMTAAQQRLWFLQQTDLGGTFYNVPSAVKITGALDGAVMGAALDDVLARHDVLRSFYIIGADGNPTQQVSPELKPVLQNIDLRHFDKNFVDAEAAKQLKILAALPFDLTQAPLLRAYLLRLGETEHILFLNLHHIIVDGWSIGILLKEILTLYAAKKRRLPMPLAAPALQFADYAAWQNCRQTTAAVDKQLDYWQNYLTGMPPVLELMPDYPRPAVQSHRGDHFNIKINAETTAKLRRFSRETNTSFFNTLLAATQLFLYKITGQEDFGIGAPIANRGRKELEEIIGFFVNTIVLRANFAENISFVELVRRVQNDILAAGENQDVPFERIVEKVQPQRDLSHSSLFQVMFDLQTSPLGATTLPDFRISLVDFDNDSAKFDLLFVLLDLGDELEANIEFNTDLFSRATIARLAGYFVRLLENIAANPSGLIADFSLLTAAEERQIVFEWNNTSTDYPRDKSVTQLFEEMAEKRASAVAIDDGERRLTYAETNRLANQIAHYLRKQGVKPGDYVATYMERSADFVAVILGILKAGAVYVPLDLAYPAARLGFMLADVNAAVLITTSDLVAALPEASTGGNFRTIVYDREKTSIQQEEGNNPQMASSPEDLAYVIYTSGSTGLPKGVAVPQRAIVRLVRNTNYVQLTENDVFSHLSNVSFDAATFEIWGALLNGGKIIVVSRDTLLSPRLFVETLRAKKVTTTFITTAYFNQITKEIPDAFSTLRFFMFGGEVCDPAAVRRVLTGGAPEHFLHVYGPTENTTFSTGDRITALDERVSNVAIGTPIANSTCYIVDKHRKTCPAYVPGELLVGGDGLAQGYANRPDLTAEKFIENPLGVANDPRVYRTGDLCRYLPDGRIEFLGRIDQQVKIRGFRVELGEIETLLKQNDQLADAVVLARDNKLGEKNLVAYVAPKPNTELDVKRLKAALLAKLPDYMVPAFFVAVEKIPLNPNGKVDKRALPDPADVERTREYIAPRNRLEEFLAGLWRELLGLEKVGIHDNFFELGGNSLKAAVFTNRLQNELAESTHVAMVFKAPTIAEMAMYMAEYFAEKIAARFGRETTGTYQYNVQVDEATLDISINDEKIAAFRRLITPLAPQPPAIQALPKNPRAVFLLSPPRSGSTLMRVMLAGNSKLFSPPELDLLSFNTLQERHAAFSHAGLEIWLQATVRALMDLKQNDAESATVLMAGYEARDLSTKEFYGEMIKLLGDRLLVDKTPTYPFDPAILKRAEEDFDQPLYIHLVRHPYAMIYSFIEAKLDENFFRYPHNFTRRELAELIWIVSNQNILDFLKDIPAERQFRLHFEAVLVNPQVEMERLCAFLGIDFQPGMLEPYKGQKMTDGVQKNGQMVGDFKFYLHKNINTSVADKWKSFHKHDFLSEAGWRLAESFGYPVEKNLAHKLRADEKLEHIESIHRDGELELSFAQQRLWFLDQFEPGDIQYNIPASVRITGQLDVALLRKTLSHIVARHETLRTTFVTQPDGRAGQVVHSDTRLDLPLVDLADYPAEERESLARQIAEAEAAKPFDLSHGPLLRAKLIALDAQNHILVLVMHHIISDGWSMNVFIREFAVIYDAMRQNRPVELPPLPIQYADYAAWQRQWLAGSRYDRELSYWRNKLADVPPALELPVDFPRTSTTGHAGEDIIFIWPEELTAKIKALGQAKGATVFMTLLAAFQLLLARCTNQADILVGTPIANRVRREIEPLIGFFVNTLVLRADLSANPTFTEFLDQVKRTALEAYDNQNIPFEKLVDELQPERDLLHTPFFQVMFALQESQLEAIQLADMTLSVFQTSAGTSKFDLSLLMVERNGKLRGQAEFNCRLFEKRTIQQFVNHLRVLLESIVANPDTPVFDLALLEARERENLAGFNLTDPPVPLETKLIHELFEERVRLQPNDVAAVYGGLSLTFAQLNARANQLAAFLRANGAGAEKFVALCLERSLDMVIGILAILKAGGAYVPMDADYPADRLAYILADSGATVVLTQHHLLDRLPDMNARLLCLDRDWEQIAACNAENVRITGDPRNIAYVIYTSGSTGNPKGVMITHASALNLLAGLKRKIYDKIGRDNLTVSLNAPLLFDASVQQWLMLLLGHKLCIMPGDIRRDADKLGEFLSAQKIDVFDCVPSQLKLLLANGYFSGRGHIPPVFLPGGEAIDSAVWQELRAIKNSTFYNMYGPTECTVDSTSCNINDECESPSIGKPLVNQKVYILDKNGRLVPVGVVGEIYIAGAGLARGYLKRPDLTAEKFLPDPYAVQPGSRMYKTGDLGRYLKDGNIEYVGRVDFQVKIRGFRIELGEIEAQLRRHPAVRDAAVIVRQDAPGDKRLAAYFTWRDEKPTVEELRQFLLKRLPDYMLPSFFVGLEELPRTPNGKLNRKALPKPQVDRADLASEFSAALTEAEKILVDIWRVVLGVETVGVDDNFFALGGDSILSIQVIARAFQRGLKLTPKQLFETPTIRGLATQASAVVTIDAEQGPVEGETPLTPIQFWFVEQNFANPDHWNQSLLLEARERLDTELLREAIAAVYAHHDALRLRLEKNKSGWRQYHTALNDDAPFEVIDLGDVPVELIQTTIDEHTNKIQAKLNLAGGPIFRCACFINPNGPDVLFFTIHHLAIDGLSWRIFLEDVARAYDTLAAGQPIHLPAKTTSFKRWAEKLAAYAGSAAAADFLSAWQEVPSVPPLPRDFASDANTEAVAAVVTIDLSPTDTFALLQQANTVYKTPLNDILLAALVKAFQDWTGCSQLAVALEGHGREAIFDDVDLSRTIGWFTTLYPVVLDIAGAGSVAEAVGLVKTQLRDMPLNGFYYGLLKYLAPAQNSSPLAEISAPEVAFNYLGQFHELANDRRFAVAEQQSRNERDPRNRRPHHIFVSGKIAWDRLQLSFSFSTRLYKIDTIERLAQQYINALRELLKPHVASNGKDSHGNMQASDQLDENDLRNVLSELE